MGCFLVYPLGFCRFYKTAKRPDKALARTKQFSSCGRTYHKATPCRLATFFTRRTRQVFAVFIKRQGAQAKLSRELNSSLLVDGHTTKPPLAVWQGVALWCTRRDSNSQRGRRRPLFYPVRLRVHIPFFKSTYILLFFAFILQAFMLYYL